MKTRPYSSRAVVAALIGAALVISIAAFPVTLARFTDKDAGPSGTTAAATVVLGGRGTPPTLSFSGVRSGSPRTVNLTIDYRGSVPATVQLLLPSGATTTSCVRSGTTWADGALVGTLTLTLGSQAAVPYCSLLDGTARTVLATVQPNTSTTVPIVATVAGLVVLSRTEKAAITIRAVGGFTDQVAGTISITTGGVFGVAAAARVAAPPTTTTTVAPAAVGPPAACVAAGLTSFAETVTLTPDRPRFVASEDRPGSAGPFLVIGTGGDDTITGSGAGDCIVGGAGNDVIDGAGGDDVLLGGDGADRIDGGAGNDRLYGEAGADRLTGGVGADVLGGGADAAECDTDPADTTTDCTTATLEGAPDPTSAAVSATSPPATTEPPAAPTATAPAGTTTAEPTTTPPPPAVVPPPAGPTTSAPPSTGPPTS